MQFKLDKLKGKIKEEGFSQKEIAEYLNIAPSTFSLKINGIVFFGADEIEKIAELLKIPGEQYKNYFFTLKV